MKKLLLLLCIGLSAMPMVAQQSNWTTYTMRNSDIGGNSILALASDSKNNLWVGTNLGLCRLSGRTWTDYSMFNDKLNNQYVNCLTIDEIGNLWIGTDDYGVIKFDGSRWTDYDSEMKRLNMKFVRDIAVSNAGVPWIGVTLSGLVNGIGDKWNKFTSTNSELLSDFILCLKFDKKGTLWVGTNDGLCSYTQDGRWNAYTMSNSEMPSDIVPAIDIASNGVYWIGTTNGLCRYDGRTWKVYNSLNSELPDNQVNDLCIDDEGVIWVATNNGVAAFDGDKHWKVYNKVQQNQLPVASVTRMIIDKRGNKWFGTEFNGLIKFAAQGISGCVKNDRGEAISGLTINCGDNVVETDENGYYYMEVPTSSTNVVVVPSKDMGTPKPAEIAIPNLRGFKFGQDFVVSSEILATGTSSERISVVPYLSNGYIVIKMESSTAKVEFLGEGGESIRTIPSYKNGNKITISKMPRRKYNLQITTPKGVKRLRFNLK